MDFTWLPHDLRDEIGCRSVDWMYEPGELLIVQERPPDCLIVIHQGDVEVGLRQKNGRVVVLAHRSAGSIIGEMAFLMAVPRTAQARAITRVRAHLLPRGDYYDLAREYPLFQVILRRLAVSRLSETSKVCFAARRYADIVWNAALAEVPPQSCANHAWMLVQRMWR